MEGMTKRRKALRDPGTTWAGLGKGLLIWVSSQDQEGIVELEREHDLLALEPLIEKGFSAQGGEPANQRLLMGYRDGLSQPYIDELASADATRRKGLAGGGTKTPDGWKPVPVGEFVLGAADAGGASETPGPAWFTLDGTFVVYRKYEVYRDRLEKTLSGGVSQGAGVGDRPLDRTGLAGKLMGRFQVDEQFVADQLDAVLHSPDFPPARTVAAGDQNDFSYGQDSEGYLCPLGAHIRRANPRDSLGATGDLVERHRIIRRGALWNEGDREGLHFVAVNARIADQFEFIQMQWLNTGHSFRLGLDVDPFVGPRPEPTAPYRFVVQGTHPFVVTWDRPFSELIGGDYFLFPGLAGLKRLAGARVDG